MGLAEADALRFGGLFCVVIEILVRAGIPRALVHCGEVGVARVFEAAFVGSAVMRIAHRHEICQGIVGSPLLSRNALLTPVKARARRARWFMAIC